MEIDIISREESTSAQVKRPADSAIMGGIVAFSFLVIEADFIRRLVLLFLAHAHSYYVLNAIAFQTCMVVAFGYWRRLRKPLALQNEPKLLDQFAHNVSVMVMMLLLSMMQFVSFVTAFDRAIH